MANKATTTTLIDKLRGEHGPITTLTIEGNDMYLRQMNAAERLAAYKIYTSAKNNGEQQMDLGNYIANTTFVGGTNLVKNDATRWEAEIMSANTFTINVTVDIDENSESDDTLVAEARTSYGAVNVFTIGDRKMILRALNYADKRQCYILAMDSTSDAGAYPAVGEFIANVCYVAGDNLWIDEEVRLEVELAASSLFKAKTEVSIVKKN